MPVLHQITLTFKAGLLRFLQDVKIFQPKYWNAMEEQIQVSKNKICVWTVETN